MPKKQKHASTFQNLKGISSSSSASSSRLPNGVVKVGLTVNERLNELRKLNATQATQKKRELAEAVAQRSVPPELTGILGVPDIAPPKPKREARFRERLRTPGPPPPKSWVQRANGNAAMWANGVSQRRSLKRSSGANDIDRNRPKELLGFARLCGLERWNEAGAGASTLTHLVLKTIATNFDLLEEPELEALAEIPLKLRLRLLSYVVFYGPAIHVSALRALLHGNECITVLDVAGLVGYQGLTVKRLCNIIEEDSDGSSTELLNAQLESWDVEDGDNPGGPSINSFSIPDLSRFSQLTHLCLSHPNSKGAKWRDLLQLSKKLPQLTHLSLAYWPRPTLTPNLSTATVSGTHAPGDVSAGGSHYYSELDDDMAEPCLLLRQLSNNLLCLQWLDLEGCTNWSSALGRLALSPQLATEISNSRRDSRREQDWASNETPKPSVFCTSWSRLAYLNLSQGWLPTKLSLRQIAGPHHPWENSDELPEYPSFSGTSPSQDVIDFEKKRAAIWIAGESKLFALASQINKPRVQNKMPSILIDITANDRRKVA